MRRITADIPIGIDTGTSVMKAVAFTVDFRQLGVAAIPGLKPEPLSIQRTFEFRDATKIPLVLHGASGVPEDEVQAAKAA